MPKPLVSVGLYSTSCEKKAILSKGFVPVYTPLTKESLGDVSAILDEAQQCQEGRLNDRKLNS